MNLNCLRYASLALATLATAPVWASSSSGGSSAAPPTIPPAPTQPYAILDNVEGDYVNLNAPAVRPMVLTPGAFNLYAVNTHASRVLHFDNASGLPSQVFHTPKSPVAIALWSDPNATGLPERLVVACRDTYALVILDRATGETLQLLELRDASGRILGEPGDLLVDQATNRAFVSCQAADAVVEVDLTAPKVVRVFKIPGKNPLFMSFDANKDVLVAPLFSGNNSGPRGTPNDPLNVMHQGPTVVDFAATAMGGTQLKDEDLFRLVRATGAVQPLTTAAGTIQFACGVNPVTGALWQLNTDANNKDPNKQTEASIRGDIVKNRLSISPLPPVGGAVVAPTTIQDLDRPGGVLDPTKTVGQPYAIEFDSATGFAVTCGLLTDNVVLLDPTGLPVDEFDVAPGGIPRGLLYSQPLNLLFVYCWGTNTIEAHIVTLGWPNALTFQLGLDPTPPKVKAGRRVAYSASHSMNNNASCLSCHVEGRTDMLAWNLGSPMDDKGPLVTQTLDGIERMVPFHWRGEQQNNLADFNAAFVNLLGATAPLNANDFADFQSFVFSLQNPPNPTQNEERLLDDRLQPNLFPGFPAAAATRGEGLFKQGCEGCHNMPTGTSNDLVADGAGFGNQKPRRAFFKIAPFHELYKKEQDADLATPGVQWSTVTLPDLNTGLPVNLIYPPLGTGLAHTGLMMNLNAFVMFFGLTPQDTADIVAFVQQFDQGIAPAAYRAVLLDQAHASKATVALQSYFVPQARARHCDLVLYGRVTLGGTSVAMRWWFDRRSNSFVAEDPTQPNQPLSFFTGQAATGATSVTAVGLPVGTGEGFGIDFDRDDLKNKADTVAANGTNPDVADSDGDTWLDGHELNNGGNPASQGSISNDVTPPRITRAVTQFVTAKVARINVETNEPCVLQANYSFGGGPNQSKTTQVPSKTHSILLNDLSPSTNGAPWITYTGTLTAIDLGSQPSQPRSLPNMPAYNQAFGGPLPITTRDFSDGSATVVVGNLSGSSSQAGTVRTVNATLRVDKKVGAPPAAPVANQIVVARVFKNGVLDASWTATGASQKLTGFNFTVPFSAPPAAAPFTGLTGPFLVSPGTVAAGTTTLTFTIPNTTASDTVTVNIEVIGPQEPTLPALTLQSLFPWSMPNTTAGNRSINL
ncbi:MAG: hypothetical protein IPJ77_01745 [Planctomycetes bacterium]|nr:hypothetical protein [Planctomycetota bacterium]